MRLFLNYWEKKTPKEQLILLGISIFCSFLLFWSMVILPINRKINTLSVEIKNKTHLLLALGHFNSSNKPTSLKQPIDLTKFEFVLKKFNSQAKIEQNAEGEYILSFSAFNFDKLLLLFEECYTEYALELLSLKIQRLAQPGFVKGEAVFALNKNDVGL